MQSTKPIGHLQCESKTCHSMIVKSWVYVSGREKRHIIYVARPSTKQLFKAHISTMLAIHTTWCRNAMTIDMVEIMTSPHPMYRCKALPYSLGLPSLLGADPGSLCYAYRRHYRYVSLYITIQWTAQVTSHPRRKAAITFHRACCHLPSRRTSPLFDQYEVILLDDR